MKEHDPVKALRNDVGITAALAVRGIKIFLADKMGVFFSLLAPIIILMLYLLFLGDIQIDALKAQLEGIPYEEKTVSAIVDGWMIAGVMAVSCITVTFASQNVLVKDRENGTLADFLAAPVKRGAIAASYMIFNIIVSAIICLAVLCLAFIISVTKEFVRGMTLRLPFIVWLAFQPARFVRFIPMNIRLRHQDRIIRCWTKRKLRIHLI